MQGAPRARGGGGFAGISRPDGAWTHSSLRAASGAVCRSGGQVCHERRFIKAPLGLSVLAGLAARHATTSPPAPSPLARQHPPQIQPAARLRALHIGRSTVSRQHLRAPSRSVGAGAVRADRGRSTGGGGVRDGADLPLEGGPEVHRTCGAPPPPSPRRQSWRSIRSWRSGSVRCPAALSSSSPRSQDEAKVVALRSNAVWGPRAPPLRPRGPAQAGSTAPDPASFNAPRLSAAASGRAGGSQRWLRRPSGRA